MGYGCKDDSAKKLKRFQRQSKRKKTTDESCNKKQYISTVPHSSPLLLSDDSATLPICTATSTSSTSLILTSNVDPLVDNDSNAVFETDKTNRCNCKEEIKRLEAEIDQGYLPRKDSNLFQPGVCKAFQRKHSSSKESVEKYFLCS